MKTQQFLPLGLVISFFISAVPVPGLSQELNNTGEKPVVPDYQVQPIFTRYARTATKITLNSTIRFFHSMELQEADDFNGYSVDLDLTVPFLKRFQVRLFYPLYTDGDARLSDRDNPDYGKSIDIEGDGGTFDFPSAILEYQFLKPESPQGWNMAAYGGIGSVFEYLKTTAPDLNSNGNDVYNHRGRVGLMGIKADRTWNDQLTAIANLGGRYYWESDDLHPKGGDVFWFLDASAAVIYDPGIRWVRPVLELVYLGDLSSYNPIQIAPEIIFPICQNFEFKAGAGLGLTNDGEDWQVRLQAAFRY